MNRFSIGLLILGAALASGCGYHVGGKADLIPKNIKTIAIPEFSNGTVRYQVASSLTADVRRFCGDHHFEPKIGSRCSQVATVKALVGIGEGISILPAGARNAEDDESLAYVALEDDKPVRAIVVLRHMQRYQSRGAEQFMTLLRERKAEAAAKAKS